MASTTYTYSVRDKAGKLVSGTLEADSQTAVVQRLRGMGYAPLSVTEANAGLKKEIKLPGMGTKIKLKDKAVFARQFATMINAGLSLLRALSILAEQTENPAFAKIIAEVRNEVETGQSLSAAMAKHPAAFPPLMVNMCKAGEVGGFLDSVLLQVAENFESEHKLRSQIKSAMTYPVMVLCMSMGCLAIMLTFIVPVFDKMFKELGAKLPAPTLLLVKISHGMKFLVPLGIISMIVFFVVWKRIKNDERVRSVVDPIKLKTPVFGPLFQKLALSRFSRNLGTMMHAGVPILQSLEIVADTTGNIVITKAVRDVQESVRQGESLAGPLKTHKVFPPMVVQMMAVGEDTGALDTMLHKISDFYDQEVQATTEALTSLLEPLMIGLLGGLVGSMIIALYMPIFSIYNHIS